MLIPIIIGITAATLGVLAWSHRKVLNIKMALTSQQKEKLSTLLPPEADWPIVEVNGERYRVSPKYIPHVGIQEAFELAQAQGMELPTKTLVDAIWKAADLKIEPQQPPLKKFDFAEMNSAATVASHAALNEKQIAGRSFKLLAGTHKDVVRDKHNGKTVNGIYGWHRLNGKPIQDFPSAHVTGNALTSDHIDYSQGARLVVRVS